MVASDLPPARVPYGDARLGVLVARRVWSGNPCTGHEQVMVSWRRPAWARAVAEGRATIGFADLAGRRCLIWVSAGMQRSATCTVVVHELGHWDGQQHTATGVMAPMLDVDYPPCRVPRDR